MDKKKVVICGATGSQGGAVLRHALNRANWDSSAFSRNPDSEKAKALEEKGVTIKKADLEDRKSLIIKRMSQPKDANDFWITISK